MQTSDTSASPPAHLAVDTNLCCNTDLYCIRCGYNLRTLAWDSVCPECGAAVQDSIWSPADLRWRGKVRRGITILFITELASTLIALYWAISALVPLTLVFLPGAWLYFVHHLVPICSAVGAFAVARAPADFRFSKFELLRTLVRLFSIGSVAAAVVLYAGSGMLLQNGTGLLIYMALAFVYCVWQCSLISYLFLVLASLGVRLRIWWMLAVGLLTVAWGWSQVNVYLFYQAGSGASGASWSFYVAYVVLNTASGLACTVFYHRCRRSMTRIIAGQSAAGAGPSQPASFSLQST